jgi:hypothetical protein
MPPFVMPAKAGIQGFYYGSLDSRLRGNDTKSAVRVRVLIRISLS